MSVAQTRTPWMRPSVKPHGTGPDLTTASEALAPAAERGAPPDRHAAAGGEERREPFFERHARDVLDRKRFSYLVRQEREFALKLMRVRVTRLRATDR